MAEPIPFKEANRNLTAPKGDSECSELPIHFDGAYCISKWRFTTEEIEQIAKTGCIYVWIQGPGTQPPMIVSTKAFEGE